LRHSDQVRRNALPLIAPYALSLFASAIVKRIAFPHRDLRLCALAWIGAAIATRGG
jgi:hypothetical protein